MPDNKPLTISEAFDAGERFPEFFEELARRAEAENDKALETVARAALQAGAEDSEVAVLVAFAVLNDRAERAASTRADAERAERAEFERAAASRKVGGK